MNSITGIQSRSIARPFRTWAFAGFTLLTACSAPVDGEAPIDTLQEDVWVNLGGLVTANPFYDQVVDNYPKTSNGLPILHTRPSAPAAIFLDFDGGTFTSGVTYPPSDYENLLFSTTSVTIGTGLKTFAVPTGLAYAPGERVRIVVNGAGFGNYMEGQVNVYNPGSISVNVQLTGGSGTFATWRIQNLSRVSFNADERNAILDAWRAAAMWVSAFNVDVTTEPPPPGNTKPTSWVAMTYTNGGNSGPPFPHWTGAGPVVGDLPGPNSNVPHEVAHGLGLEHTARFDFLGLETSEYSDSASTPIITSFMGDGNEQAKKMAKWVMKIGGTYGFAPLDPNKIQSEIDVMTATLALNGVTPISVSSEPDGSTDFSGLRTSAASLISLGAHSYARAGHLHSLSDIDYFSFQPTRDGYYSILVGRDVQAPVDTAVILQSSTGSALASDDGDPSDPTPDSNVYDQHLTRYFNSGSTYYIRVESHGGYADMGQYVVRASYVGDENNPWQANDIGVNNVPGYSSYDPDGHTYVIAGSGANVQDIEDGQHLLSQQLRGDGEISARVTHLDVNNPWGLAGITIRESLLPGSKHATLAMTKRHGWHCLARASAGVKPWEASQSGNVSFTAKYLKLTRTGSSFAYYASSDGVNWGSPVCTQTVSMSTTNPIHIGFVVSGTGKHFVDPLTGGGRPGLDAHRLAAAAFRNLSLRSTGSGVLNPQPYVVVPGLVAPGLTVFLTTPSSVSLTWTDPNSAETGYAVERSEDRIVWRTVATFTGNVTSFADTGLDDYRTYYYRVRALGSAGTASSPSIDRAARTKPGTVSNIRVHTLEGGTIVLDWDDVDGEAGYVVQRATAPSTTFVDIGNLPANGRIFVDSQSKSAATTYSYQIHTLISGGGSVVGPQKDVSTRSTSILSPSILSRASTQISLFWSAISIGPFTPAEYRVYRRPGTGGGVWVHIATTSALGYIDNGLSPATSYQYQVVACTSGTAPACSKATIVTTSTT